MQFDLVIPMVFPDDPVWQEEYIAHHDGKINATGNVRFRSWDTEELLVRCIRKFMPWLRIIHILLASESQAGFLAAEPQGTVGPKVRLVFHREFMPEHLLPCFNICTIEMFLHKIPELSETFIYSNDDFFPLSPLEPSDFFRAAETHGTLLPCQHFVEKPFPDTPNIFQKFVKNGLDMVATDFGAEFPHTWLRGGHTMQPMLRSTVEKVCTLHADRIAESFTVERAARNFNQYIFPFYQHLSGQYIDHTPPHRYAGPRTATADLPGIIRSENVGIVCLNDNECIADWKERARLVRHEIGEKLRMKN